MFPRPGALERDDRTSTGGRECGLHLVARTGSRGAMKMNLLVMMHDGALGLSYEGGEGVSCAPNAGWRVEGRGSQTGRAFSVCDAPCHSYRYRCAREGKVRYRPHEITLIPPQHKVRGMYPTMKPPSGVTRLGPQHAAGPSMRVHVARPRAVVYRIPQNSLHESR